MQTELGDMLKGRRGTRSLRDVGGRDFTAQGLSNYEQGYRLPQRDKLPLLADLYGVNFADLEAAFYSSIEQVTKTALLREPFLDLLKSVQPKDHVLVIGQRSVVADHPHLVSSILELLGRDVLYTYVAYMQTEGASTRSYDEWTPNLQSVARTLLAQLDLAGQRNRAKHQCHFYLIGNPDQRDLYYLAGPGVKIYLCRREGSSLRPAKSWQARKFYDGELRWSPYDEVFLYSLGSWLTSHCGLDLPSTKFNKVLARKAGDRKIRMQSLEEFVAAS